MTDKNKLTLIELKHRREDALNRTKINFRYMMGVAEILSPFFIQSIPAALTIVSIGNLFPSLLHIPPLLAWVLAALVGIGLELLGIVSVDVYFEAKSYNQKYKDDNQKAPENAALLVMLVYAITALLTVVFLKMFPVLAIWSLIPLTLMSILIVSSVTMKKQIDELLLQKDDNVNNISPNENENVINILQNTINKLTEMLTENVNNVIALQTVITEMSSVAIENNMKITMLTDEIANMKSENVNNTENVNTPTVNKKVKSVIAIDNTNTENVKLTKEQKMQLLIDYLIENYNGIATSEIVNTQIAENLPIDNVTVGRYMKELRDKNKLNGHVDAALLRS